MNKYFTIALHKLDSKSESSQNSAPLLLFASDLPFLLFVFLYHLYQSSIMNTRERNLTMHVVIFDINT